MLFLQFVTYSAFNDKLMDIKQKQTGYYAYLLINAKSVNQ